MEDRLRKLEVDVVGLTNSIVDLRTRLAVKDERERHVDEKLEAIKKEVDGLKNGVNKIFWLVLAALIGGFLQFVMRGGLAGLGGP